MIGLVGVETGAGFLSKNWPRLCCPGGGGFGGAFFVVLGVMVLEAATAYDGFMSAGGLSVGVKLESRFGIVIRICGELEVWYLSPEASEYKRGYKPGCVLESPLV